MSFFQSGRLVAAASFALSAFLLACSGTSDPADLATATTSEASVSATEPDAEVQAATTERQAESTSVTSIVPTTAAPTTTEGEADTTLPDAETATSLASSGSSAADEADDADAEDAPTTSAETAPPTSEAVNDSAVPSTTAPAAMAAPTTTAAPATTSAAPATTAPSTTGTSATPSTTATTSPSTTATPTTAAPTTAAPATTVSSTTAPAAPSTTSSSIATVRTPSSVVAGSSGSPASAISLAAELTQAEQAIRNPAVSDARAAEWGRRQQRLYRELSRNSEWAPTVIELVAADVRNAVELNWGARSNLNSLGKKYPIQPTLPAWRIKEPAPASDLTGFYREGEGNTGVSWTILAAINLVETRMGRIEGVSTAGAMGPMQFLPTTWNECCEGDPTDPHDAIIGAAHYLTVRGAPGNLDRAIFGYNNSNNYVTAVKNYAAVMAEDPLAYRGYYAWEVYYRSSAGLVRLPIGYEELQKVDAAEWLKANPSSRISD